MEKQLKQMKKIRAFMEKWCLFHPFSGALTVVRETVKHRSQRISIFLPKIFNIDSEVEKKSSARDFYTKIMNKHLIAVQMF